MEWKEVRLGDVCDLVAGYAFKAKDFGDFPHKVIKIGDINPPFVNYESELGVNLENYDTRKLEKYLVRYDDFVLAMTGATIGKVGRYVAQEPSYLNQRVLLFKAKENVCSKLLYYIVTSPIFAKYVINHIDSESAQPNISAGTISKYELQIPSSIDAQRRISSILSSLDRKIELNNKINATLEEMAQALFKSWFVDFEPFKNGNFIDTEIGKIPEGWRVGTLGEVCTTNKRTYRGTIKAPIKYLDTGSVTRNKIEGFQLLDPTIDKIPSRAKRLVQEGDIVYSTVRPNQEHYGFLLDPPFDLVVSTGFCVISAQRSAYRYFIYNVLTQPCVIEKLHTIAEQSVSTYPSINASDIENVEIIIPSDDVIDRFASCTLPFYLRIEKLSQETLTLTHLRDTLLPRLMSGEIEV